MDVNQTQLQDPEQLAKAKDLSVTERRPPLHVAGYVMEGFLGEGAFGEVWVAVKKNTNQRVAIKFCTRRRAEDWALLVREVEKLAQLSTDTHVVKLLDTDPASDPPFFIMEYLERGSLDNELHENGTLPVDQALAIFRDTAVGIAHSHGKGILHCDLKPANILLDQDGRPRICDFGQSRLSSEQTPALGTLFYMAPEQASLEAVPDVRWDVYALGALLHCMLVGHPPYRSDANVAALQAAPSLAERLALYREIIGNSSKPVEHRSVPGVDRLLAEIIDRCLATNPEKRFANVQVVLDELSARNVRLSRRPLYVLGALGPALLLGVVSIFAAMGFHKSVDDSQHAVIDRALESKEQSAWAYAEIVARELQSRWEALKHERERPELLEMVKSHQGLVGLDDDNNELEAWLGEARNRHAHLSSSSWFITDRHGYQLARAPHDDDTYRKKFDYRDYFHGLGYDLPPAADGKETQYAPIRDQHLSSVFLSKASNRRMVAFSLPLMEEDPATGEETVWGIMAMTVELGHFTEVQREDQPEDQYAVLVDCRIDSQEDGSAGQAGSLLEHPCFATHEKTPNIYLDAKMTELVKKICSDDSSPPDRNISDYSDPVRGGEWLAAIEPVILKAPNAPAEHTGWAVIVQEPIDKVLGPINRLRDTLMSYGFIMLGVLATVLAALWGLVMLNETDGKRTRWLRYLRRRLGLSTATSSVGTATATASAEGTSTKSSARSNSEVRK